jgi:large subunit ribosomal protein L24
MNTLHVKTGDTVIVLSGKDKGKTGKVLSADPKKATVIVENVNIVTKHQKKAKSLKKKAIFALAK